MFSTLAGLPFATTSALSDKLHLPVNQALYSVRWYHLAVNHRCRNGCITTTVMDLNLLPTWHLRDPEWSSSILQHARLFQLQLPAISLPPQMMEIIPRNRHLQHPASATASTTLRLDITETQALISMILDIHPGPWMPTPSPCPHRISILW